MEFHLEQVVEHHPELEHLDMKLHSAAVLQPVLVPQLQVPEEQRGLALV